MNILLISTEKLPVPPVLGGAIQTYIEGALPHLSQVHNITVLGIQHATLANNETVERIRYVRVQGDTFDRYQREVIDYVSQHSFDLIHIFNRPRLVLPVRNVAAQTKITLSMHNDMFTPEKIPPEEARRVIHEVSNIVTISNYIGDRICEFYPEARPKLHTIYSGVDSDRFFPGNHPRMRQVRDQIRKAHGLENRTVILFAGRLSNNKGVDRLVRALPQLSEKYKNLALVIVGSNWFSQNDVTDYVAYVRALANKLPIPVVTTGFVAPNEIQNWFAAADMFVCTSIWQEPLARVHYEAMAAGLPIVTTARGGNPEVIEPGGNGYIVEQPEDPQNFVDTISTLLSNPSLMKKMGERGRELALTKYQWKRVASDILRVWNVTFTASLPDRMQAVPYENIETGTDAVIHSAATEPIKSLEVDQVQPSTTLQPLSFEELVAEAKRKKKDKGKKDKVDKMAKVEKYEKGKVEKKEKDAKKEKRLLNQPKISKSLGKDDKKAKDRAYRKEVMEIFLEEWVKATQKAKEEKSEYKKKRKI